MSPAMACRAVMRWTAVALDYDGTIATAGRVQERTLNALDRARASGRKLVLVSGRRIEDLARVFSALDRFDRVVAENGAVLHAPSTRELRALHDPPPPRLVAALRARGVDPLAVGHVVVATTEAHEQAVLEAARALAVEVHLERNKGALMVLPPGVTKAGGLAAALEEIRVAPRDVVGVGDAENDEALLASCGLAVAVGNALPSVKRRCDWVTPAADGEGVVQLVDALLAEALPTARAQRR